MIGALVVGAHLLVLLSPHRLASTVRRSDHGRVTVVLLPSVHEASKAAPLEGRREQAGAHAPRHGGATIAIPRPGPFAVPPPLPGSAGANVEADGAPTPAGGNARLDLTYRPERAVPEHPIGRLPREAAGDQGASAFERGMTRAQRPDCRRAYADLGLLAIPILLLEPKDQGCTW